MLVKRKIHIKNTDKREKSILDTFMLKYFTLIAIKVAKLETFFALATVLHIIITIYSKPRFFFNKIAIYKLP